MTTENASELTMPRFRLLIVTNAAAAGPASLPPVVRFLIQAASVRFVVSPRLTTPLQWLETDIDGATVQARTRLDAVLGHFGSDLAPISGAIGDDTLLLAIDDAINDFGPDHLLIGLRDHERDGQQERHLLDKVRRRFHMPLTVFEVDEAG
jgi:hypothetical protein